jgi:cephalosporin hydroxylase
MIKIDLENNCVIVEDEQGDTTFALDTPEAFSIISDAWLRCGWDNKHVYSFTWLGRPIIQLPEDMFRIQEVIYQIKPDVIIETGIAHGGSLIYYATLCKAMGRGRIIGIDIEIRPHNRKAIEEHELFEYITLIEGSSIDQRSVEKLKPLIRSDDKVFVILDSNHSKKHVLKELEIYSKLVSVGSYIVVSDGIMENLVGAPRSQPDWSWNNPKSAAEFFVQKNPDFTIEEPAFPFNEGNIQKRITYWPNAWLKRNK